MSLNWGKILLTAVVVEVLAIIGLVLVVALFGPSDADAAQAYAVRVGTWFGPAAGFVLCIVGGWFVAKNLESGQVVNGVALGVAVAVIDVLILVLSGSDFQFVFVLSNVGRVIAGLLGGWLAMRSRVLGD